MMSMCYPMEHMLREWGDVKEVRDLYKDMNVFMYHG